MSAKRFPVVAGLVLAAVCFVPERILAQPATGARPDAAPKAKPEFLVVPLKNATASDAARVVKELLGGDQQVRLTADAVTNSVFVAGNPEQLLLVNKILVQIDEAGQRPQPPLRQLSVLTLTDVEADARLEEALRLIVQSPNRFALDQRLKQVVVSADKNTLASVETLLTRMEQQARRIASRPRDVQLRVVWLASGLAQDAPRPPADLQGVLGELEKIGVGDLRLVSQSVIKTTAGATFNLSGSARLSGPCELSIKGNVSDRDGEAPTLQINIDATTQTVDRKSGAVVAVTPVCRLATSIAAPVGHSVVLGVTPSESLTSVFIVQLMASKSSQTSGRR
jgi:hypothetical protein